MGSPTHPIDVGLDESFGVAQRRAAHPAEEGGRDEAVEEADNLCAERLVPLGVRREHHHGLRHLREGGGGDYTIELVPFSA